MLPLRNWQRPFLLRGAFTHIGSGFVRSGTRSKPPALRGRTEVPRHAVRLRQVEVATLTISAERRRRAQSTPGTIRFSALSFPLAATLARHQVALLSAESGPRNDGQCESAALVDAIGRMSGQLRCQ